MNLSATCLVVCTWLNKETTVKHKEIPVGSGVSLLGTSLSLGSYFQERMCCTHLEHSVRYFLLR